jgi:DNA-binding NtrC family response regulator
VQRRAVLISQDAGLREGIGRWLTRRGWALESSAGSQRLDAVIADLGAPASDPQGALAWSALSQPDAGPAVLALCPAGMIELGVAALKQGADDFLLRPFDAEELEIRLERALERRALQAGVAVRGVSGGAMAGGEGARHLTGCSAAIAAVREQVARAAGGTATVLLTGETGTGKELVATLLHEGSPRRHCKMVRVNCAALPEPLLESELFGHERGAFTGAEQRRIGRFEEAHGGTLFLDEIGDMHGPIQAKVLRALQEREFQRLGGSESIRVDVRVIAATNQDLRALIEQGRFRQDLYYRLNVVRIQLPALRQRLEDVLELAEEFLRELAGGPRPLTPAARAALLAHPWPGNIRELRNVLERAVLMAPGACVDVGDLDLEGAGPASGPRPPRGSTACGPLAGPRAGPASPEEGRSAVVRLPPGGIDHREVERQLIVQALECANWLQKDAAELLRMSRRKLNYRIRRLGITHAGWRTNRAVPDASTARRDGSGNAG